MNNRTPNRRKWLQLSACATSLWLAAGVAHAEHAARGSDPRARHRTVEYGQSWGNANAPQSTIAAAADAGGATASAWPHPEAASLLAATAPGQSATASDGSQRIAVLEAYVAATGEPCRRYAWFSNPAQAGRIYTACQQREQGWVALRPLSHDTLSPALAPMGAMAPAASAATAAMPASALPASPMPSNNMPAAIPFGKAQP